ncbi:SDR family NAD(P)-dependent oxidoreductase [Autumnicola musiva]|uniref:SDR family oxidoreductase n=1 Tax=Autumnicola musiva TaxID=3075589 RepID=A0ABU3D6J6_9FLAO|nr:SDR family oxidoreductase [Zunongwangia sp. F117]MDT0677157.1 SDR family oxidoreductase [Zunongwangia sp. F117]
MKNIIITGTSRGIGYEMVSIFAKAGHRVLALSRNEEPVEKMKLENVTAISCDIGKKQDLAKVSDFVSSQWESVDILINNAGKLINKPFAELTSEDFDSVYKTNLMGVVELIRNILPYMRKEGHVVNISTMGGVQGSVKFPGLSAYSSSKAAVITLTELLAEEYKEAGPSFNVLALGAVQTEMLEEAFPGLKAPLSAEEMAAYIVNFSLTGNKFYNGKLLQVSSSTP